MHPEIKTSITTRSLEKNINFLIVIGFVWSEHNLFPIYWMRFLVHEHYFLHLIYYKPCITINLDLL